jgi:integrase
MVQRHMSKGEIDFEARIWTIPGERTKNHRLHVVPLSDLALELILAALAFPAPTGLEGKVRFVFPSPKGDQPITRRAFSRAMKRITEASKINDATPHDFRRTGSTHLTSERLGVPRFHVSCVLNHISDTGGAASVTAVYDRNAYLPEKRRALDKWANRLVAIVSDRCEYRSVQIDRLSIIYWRLFRQGDGNVNCSVSAGKGYLRPVIYFRG